MNEVVASTATTIYQPIPTTETNVMELLSVQPGYEV